MAQTCCDNIIRRQEYAEHGQQVLPEGRGYGHGHRASMGMLMAPKKKGNNVIGRALKAAGELADNITEAMK